MAICNFVAIHIVSEDSASLPCRVCISSGVPIQLSEENLWHKFNSPLIITVNVVCNVYFLTHNLYFQMRNVHYLCVFFFRIYGVFSLAPVRNYASESVNLILSWRKFLDEGLGH
jgi:hypothetical protein